MKMLSSNNLHITLTDLLHASRVLKETASITENNVSKHVYIAALHADDLSEYESISSNIELKRFKLSSRNLSKNLLVQLIKYLELVFRVAFFYRKKKIDMVNIHGLEILPLGVLLKYLYGAKLIYDTHELETERNGLQGIKKKLSKWIERLFINQADQIFVVSESIADWYANEYGISRPVVVMNTPRRLPVLNYSNYFRERFSIPQDSFIVLYQGGLAKGRGVDLLLAAFKERSDNRVVIIFMGYGVLESQIQSAADTHHNIYFHPAVPPNVVLDYTVSADIGISFIENICLSYFYCMPNKLFEYAMVGLPVVVSKMKEMQAFVESKNIGVVVEDSTPEAVNHAIDKIIDMDIKQLKKNAYQAAMLNAWEEQEVKMINAYNNIFKVDNLT